MAVGTSGGVWDPVFESDIGGAHFLGCGTYEARTPEEAEILYDDLKAAGAQTTPPGGAGKEGTEDGAKKGKR